MADPFQDVDAAGADFITMFADAMDMRQSDPTMEAIVADYLDRLDQTDVTRIVEIGAGAGAVSRRIAARFPVARVTGFEPSEGFVKEARSRAAGVDNLSFEVADGAALPVAEDSVDAVVIHTVLSHVTDPFPILKEALRVLRPGGRIAVCDADFSKGSFASFPNDPLDSLARTFVSDFVTDAYIVGKLRGLLTGVGLAVDHFQLWNRLTDGAPMMLPWVEVTTKQMVERGQIGAGLRDALIEEHNRRVAAKTLYGFQLFATAIGTKPQM
ncbi:class I SAM-dependent methyltransferase [Marivivens marinus]|uniref:class I SAM-dependent methyltransferase n=1 Tax=Marivivens marinus TaxID=3110173 RepID=UPI003B84729A